jgi:flavodoxin I
LRIIIIFYGSSGGNTKVVAEKIATKLGVAKVDIHDVAKAKVTDLAGYSLLIFGTSTWGLGDLQDDWYDFLKILQAADLTGKKVALFGCGDSSSYPDTFCDGMGKIYAAIRDRAEIIGSVDVEGYFFDASEAVVDGKFVGLPLDEDNESNLTDLRISTWVTELKALI